MEAMAEKYANVERIGENNLGQAIYRSTSDFDLHHRDLRMNGFRAGYCSGLKAGRSLTETEKLRVQQARDILAYPNYVPFMASLLAIIDRLSDSKGEAKT